nr:ORF1 [Anelloviridae sp.]
MPFWWKRRRRPWFGRLRYRRRFQTKRRKYRRRRFTRRRNRKPARRRRRRHHKVRRKLKKIKIQQWQPDSIRKCKIKGLSTLVLGAAGRQGRCYTNTYGDYIQPKAPAGGGFGSELITLKWLYSEYLAHRNIWTTTNEYKDLLRYTGCTITLFRHPEIDFVIKYELQPPFDLNKYTYAELQPHNMLLAKRKKILLSQRTNPRGKLKVKLKIKPPKQMITKWFFAKDFCPFGLVKISASAANFNYPNIPPGSQSNILTVYSLNTMFYHNSNWLINTPDQGYVNITTQKFPMWFKYKDRGAEKWYKYYPNDNKILSKYNHDKYLRSISYEDGFFNPKILLSYEVKVGGSPDVTTPDSSATPLATLPLVPLRYNPEVDNGFDNIVYLTSIAKGSFDKPTVTPDYIFTGVPLWMIFFGYQDFLLQKSNDKGLLTTHMFVVKSPALRPISQTTEQRYYPILNLDFAFGRLPYDEYISANIKSKWYPTAEQQDVIINDIVTTGPYIPKFYTNQPITTWELDYRYSFYFKWGGPEVTDPKIEDPCTRGTYPVPDKLHQGVQIKNPEKLDTNTIFHEWDYRRGIITQSALKRMSANLEIDTDFENDITETPRKRQKVSKEIPCIENKQKEIQTCLQELCSESSFQETPENLQQYIQQQQHQQHKLKRNLILLLTHLKKEQRCLQLQTGLLD